MMTPFNNPPRGSQAELQQALGKGVRWAKAVLWLSLVTTGVSISLTLPTSLAGSLHAQAAETTFAKQLSPEQRQTLDRYFEALESHHKLMGGVALSQGGQVIYERYLGQLGPANANGSAPQIGPDTQMRIGSISKSFTAVMIMQLIEAGQLSLDTPLASFFPQLPQADKISVSDLLNHRSGLVNFTNLADYSRYMTQPQTPEAMLQRIASQPLAFPPGSKAQYSNSNYYLLSLILEKRLGVPYAHALSEKIVKPLGLQHTDYGQAADPTGGSARSFSRKEGQWVLERQTDMSIPLGAGAIVSTPRDLNRFFRALFQGGLVSKASLKLMTELRDGYGRGLFAYPFGEQQGYGHNGGIDGFVSTSAYFPAWDLNLTVLSNGQDLPLNDVALALMTVYAGQPFTPPDFSEQAIALTEAQASALLGSYASAQIPLKIRVFWQDQQLMAQATGQQAFPLTAFSERLFRFDQAGVQMQFDEGPSPKGFVLSQGGQDFRFERE